MIEIKLGNIGPYKNLNLIVNNNTIHDLGIIDKEEALNLLKHLENIVQELEEYIED